MALEVVRVETFAAEEFFHKHQREALKAAYNFNVIWHEQRHAFLALRENDIAGAAQILIAASLAHVERVIVRPELRRHGIGSALLASAAETANYYNCHKMSAMAVHHSAAQSFFEACGYKVEAVLPQHTFKLDIAVLRKFLL